MSCTLTYGAITLENVIINSIKSERVMGEDGITFRYQRYLINFAAHCSPSSFNDYSLRDGLARRASFTAEALLEELSKPRQYFRLEFNSVSLAGPSSIPALGQTVDATMGPTPKGIQVTNILGEIGYPASGYFLVSGVYEVCISNSNNSGYIQGYSMGRDHDVDADTFLTTITSSVMIYGKPEAIRSLEGGGDQSVWVGFPDLALILSYVPPGFKRRRAKIQVKPGATEAIVHLVDEEMHLPLGGLSPASAFESTQVDATRVDLPAKEGAVHTMRIVTVNANCPKNDTRERVLKQMLYWVMIKGQGGSGPGALSRRPRFMYYSEVTVSVSYATNQMQLTAKIAMQPANSGFAGMPYSLTDNRMLAQFDYPDVDEATAPYRGANGFAQGTQRGLAASPGLNYHGTAGSYIADVLCDRIKLPRADDSRVKPDGVAAVCNTPSTSASMNFPQQEGYYSGPIDTAYAEVEITDLFTLGDISLGWITTLGGNVYESTWMQTKYDTEKGTMVLPTGGVMPGGVTPPDEIRKRVQVTLHEGKTVKAVHWGIQSVGQQPPIYPDSTPTDNTQILIKQKVQPAACNPVGPGMYAWTITGTYWYDLLDLKQPGDRLGVGKLPITPGNAATYSVPGGNASPGYIPPS